MFVQKTQHEEQPWKIKLIATMLPKKKKNRNWSFKVRLNSSLHCFWHVPVQSVSEKHSPIYLEWSKWSTEMEEVCICSAKTTLPRSNLLAAYWRLTLKIFTYRTFHDVRAAYSPCAAFLQHNSFFYYMPIKTF